MRRLLQVAVVGCIVAVASAVRADLASYANHSGSTDPLTEGFAQDGTGASAVLDAEVSPSVAAWNVPGGWDRYKKDLSSVAENMMTNGFVANYTVRNKKLNDYAQDAGVYFELALNTSAAPSVSKTIALCVGSDASGNPTLWREADAYNGGRAYQITELPGNLGSGYHTYSVKWDPHASAINASVYCDGSFVTHVAWADNDSGLGSRNVWGVSTSLADVGDANWSAVSITALPVPEPSTIALLVTGVFGLIAYAWRKRR
jgi:hypothetical protein